MGDMTDAPAMPEHRPHRWIPLITGLAAFIVVGIAGGLVAADWVWRGLEMNALVTAVEASEDAMGRSQEDLAAAAAALQGVAKPTADEKAGLAADVSAAGARAEQRVQAAGLVVGQVAVLPWHREILQAQGAYVAHNLAWQDYLAQIAGDPAVYGTDQPLIDETFMASEPLMKAAVPDPDLFELGPRVDAIYTEGAPAAAGDPGQEVAYLG